MSAIDDSAKPCCRGYLNASSRSGPMVPLVPAAASVWQEPHFPTNSCSPRLGSPPVARPTVPQPAATSAARITKRAPAARKTTRILTLVFGRGRRSGQLLQRLPDLWCGRVVRGELEEALERRDRRGEGLLLLGGEAELELNLGDRGVLGREPLEARDGAAESGLELGAQPGGLGLDERRRRLLDRVAERRRVGVQLAEHGVRRGDEDRAGRE